MSKLVLLVIGFIAVTACGSSGQSLTSHQASGTVTNPNFDNGLMGWTANGNVSVVESNAFEGLTHAAVINYDGNTSASLTQEVDIERATNVGVGYWQLGPSYGTVLVALSQNGNLLVSSGESVSTAASSSIHAQAVVQPGKLKFTLYIDMSSSQSSPDVSTAQVSGFYVLPDAPPSNPTL